MQFKDDDDFTNTFEHKQEQRTTINVLPEVCGPHVFLQDKYTQCTHLRSLESENTTAGCELTFPALLMRCGLSIVLLLQPWSAHLPLRYHHSQTGEMPENTR